MKPDTQLFCAGALLVLRKTRLSPTETTLLAPGTRLFSAGTTSSAAKTALFAPGTTLSPAQPTMSPARTSSFSSGAASSGGGTMRFAHEGGMVCDRRNSVKCAGRIESGVRRRGPQSRKTVLDTTDFVCGVGRMRMAATKHRRGSRLHALSPLQSGRTLGAAGSARAEGRPQPRKERPWHKQP